MCMVCIPKYEHKFTHVVSKTDLIQIADQLMPDNIEYFVKILDTILKRVYSDFETKSYKDISMAYPVVEIAHKHLIIGLVQKTWQVRDSQNIKCCALPLTLILWTI